MEEVTPGRSQVEVWGIAQQADGTACAKAEERAWLELPRLRRVRRGVGEDSRAGGASNSEH